MSSIPFPEFPLDVDVDGPDRLQATTPTGFANPPLAAPSMLQHAASSPSLNNAATPAESVALSIHYQSSDFSELDGLDDDDSYFNTIFATTGGNAPSFLGDTDTVAAEDVFDSVAIGAHTYATPQPVFGETALFPLSPNKTPALNTLSSPDFTAARDCIAHDTAPIAGFDGLVSTQQLTKFPPVNVSPPNVQAFVVSDLPTQLTPDTASSRSPEAANTNDRHSLSTENTSIQAPSMSYYSPNPHVTVSLWGKDDEKGVAASEHDAGGQSTSALESASNAADDGFTVASGTSTTGRGSRQGIDPLSRPYTELPTSINEDSAAREIKEQNTEVSKWIANTEQQAQNPLDNENENRSGPDTRDPTVFEGVSDREVGMGHETENVEKSGRTYLKKETTGSLNATDYEILVQSTAVWSDRPSVLPISNSADRQLPQTSQAAIEYFERMLHDNVSIVSRAATWGTRRRSLPSTADISEVTSGNLFKKLSISGRDTRRSSFLGGLRTLVRKPSTSQQPKRGRDDDDATSYFAADATRDPQETDDSRRDSIKSSTGTLGLPRSQSWGKNKQPTPSINTALISMGSNMASIGATHTRSGSVSRPHAASISLSPPMVSPKSPLLKVGSAIGLRPRSRSEVRGSTEVEHPNLVRMLKATGGPPVASLATANATPSFPGSTPSPTCGVPSVVVPPSASALNARVPTPIQIPPTQVAVRDPDAGEDEDEEDEGHDADDTDFKPYADDRDGSDELIDNITPDLSGFRDLVIKLNPMLAEKNTYLVDRVAHQQVARYKGLLNARIKHLGAVKARTCTSGPLCIAQGGAATILDSRGGRRGRDPLSAVSRDGDNLDDLSSSLDGSINTDSFPKHIPMPPTAALPAEFECQLCFQTRTPQKPSDWTKHVHEDVQPFTCTWERCREPKMFKRKADWVRHENEGHRRLEWWTCDVDECRHTCYRRDNFLQHLVREHKFPEPQFKTKAAIKRAGTVDETWRRVDQCHADSAGPPQDEPCRFCGKAFPTWKKLTVHVAKHLEQISLPILRLVERKDVEADTIISPVQDPPPRPFSQFSSPVEARQPGEFLGDKSINGSNHLPPSMMSSPPGLDRGLLQQSTAAYAAAIGMHGTTGSFMYPSVPQVAYQQQHFLEQPQYGDLPSHMHDLDAATLEVSPAYSTGPAFAGQNFPATSGAFLGPATQYMPDTSGAASAYQSLARIDALGLQATIIDGSRPLPGSTSGQYTPQGSVSPYQHSPYQHSPHQRSPHQHSPHQHSPHQHSPHQHSPHQPQGQFFQ